MPVEYKHIYVDLLITKLEYFHDETDGVLYYFTTKGTTSKSFHCGDILDLYLIDRKESYEIHIQTP